MQQCLLAKMQLALQFWEKHSSLFHIDIFYIQYLDENMQE